MSTAWLVAPRAMSEARTKRRYRRTHSSEGSGGSGEAALAEGTEVDVGEPVRLIRQLLDRPAAVLRDRVDDLPRLNKLTVPPTTWNTRPLMRQLSLELATR